MGWGAAGIIGCDDNDEDQPLKIQPDEDDDEDDEDEAVGPRPLAAEYSAVASEMERDMIAEQFEPPSLYH